MSEKEVKSWLDIAPAYLNFAIRFLRWERTAFANVAKAGEVSRDLTSILLGGIALSYLIAVVAAPARLEQDPSRLVQWLPKVEYHLLPLFGLFATLVLAIATHLLGKLFARFSALGRNKPGGDAIALVEVDGAVPADVLAKVQALPQVKQAKALAF